MQNNSKFEIFFPGFVRKSVSFTMDDGWILHDAKFLSYVRPAGIKGTFNLYCADRATPEEYRAMYDGYEIANHSKHHPMAFVDGKEYVVSDEPHDPETSKSYTPENPVIYKSTVADGIYLYSTTPEDVRPKRWLKICDAETYFKYSRESRREIEAVFGEGSVKSFVWPYCEQSNKKLFELLSGDGYNSIRKTGEIGDTTDFDLPRDRMRWSYNATNRSLLRVMEEYENFEDDGRLKFFCFGVHASDFERDNNWCDLEKFVAKYGNRPCDFYYATVSDILEYEDAVKALSVSDNELINGSDVTLYIGVKGEHITLAPHSKISV